MNLYQNVLGFVPIKAGVSVGALEQGGSFLGCRAGQRESHYQTREVAREGDGTGWEAGEGDSTGWKAQEGDDTGCGGWRQRWR